MAEQPGTLAEALIRLQASLPRITKDAEGQVGQRTYPYATLSGINDAMIPLLCELGLLWTCKPTMSDGQFVLAYQMKHVPSGEADSGEYPLPSSTPQTMGGAISYARRYAFNAYVNLAPVGDDDDAQAAEKQARASYEERVAAGRMSREQMREHGQLERDVKSSPKRAERTRGPAGDDPWASPVEEAPGSITGPQLARLHTLFAKVGAGEREDRLALAMSLLNLPELASSKDLSFRQAELLARKLEDHTRGDS